MVQKVHQHLAHNQAYNFGGGGGGYVTRSPEQKVAPKETLHSVQKNENRNLDKKSRVIGQPKLKNVYFC